MNVETGADGGKELKVKLRLSSLETGFKTGLP